MCDLHCAILVCLWYTVLMNSKENNSSFTPVIPKLYTNENVVIAPNCDVTLRSVVNANSTLSEVEPPEFVSVIEGILIRSMKFSASDPRFAKVTPERWAAVVKEAAAELDRNLEEALFTFVHTCESFLDGDE